jgi:hypothetical protein
MGSRHKLKHIKGLKIFAYIWVPYFKNFLPDLKLVYLQKIVRKQLFYAKKMTKFSDLMILVNSTGVLFHSLGKLNNGNLKIKSVW